MELGGKRRRRKVIRKVPKRLPSVFICPSCGQKSLKVNIDSGLNKALIKCGSCQLETYVDVIPLAKSVDAYGKFIDKWYAGEIAV